MAQVNVAFQPQASVRRSLEMAEWLHRWNKQLQIRGNLWLTPRSANSPDVLKLTSQQMYLKKRPVGCFLYFIFQDQYLCTKFCWTGHWSSITSSSHTSELASLAASLFAEAFVFSSRTLFCISPLCCMEIISTVQRHYCKCSMGLAFLWYVHTVFSCQGFCVRLVQPSADIICSEWLPGNAGSQMRAVTTTLLRSSVKLLCSRGATERGTLTHPLALPFCNIPWSKWNLVNLTASPLDQWGPSDLDL